ncbi:hypothetical protein F2Q70_00006995 [Brassica cretica]|uniref:Pentacotripeptide-repeat region of PRORP domain-containing protein n=1 Tax=Brassica cretica TaxID=69181 RepID=A0A8S9M4G0_BRACR|nr:hypothetical protein F2Q70_00006995 [Brassica cretica]
MVSREILPTPVSYSIMVNALCSKGHLSEAFRGYCWSGNASDGESFLDKMVSEGFVPDFITYNTLIYGYDREENMSRAFGLVKKMEEEKQGGGLLVPDVFTYNSILHGFCRQNQMKETEAVLRKMIERGVNPDKSTYTARINGFVSQDNLTMRCCREDSPLMISSDAQFLLWFTAASCNSRKLKKGTTGDNTHSITTLLSLSSESRQRNETE